MKKKDFFISYTGADRHYAEWIVATLESNGYTTIVDYLDFLPGKNYILTLDEAMRQAERTIAVVSPDYFQAQYTAPEWATALVNDPKGNKGLLIPVIVRPVELIGILKTIVYIDLVDLISTNNQEEEARERLLRGIRLIKREQQESVIMFKIRQHTIFPEEFPEAWASDWGEDEFGLWMAFTYKGVRQAFRWCEPGTFLMGSPEDEPERESFGADETQHQVTLTKGFWIADTPVTQVLWQVVMGENPSTFKGDESPVENVSWDDAQTFISKMNGLKAELKLCLPTEAQWEYACRAGTTTPFSWGEQIDSRYVNFNGNHPYNNGSKSEFRERTVAVKELPCNDWGLHQMHGNVWEWCQDWYGKYPSQPVSDPQGPETGANRVLRGGSWFSNGRVCRSADRSNFDPSLRGNYIGFRLARGQ